MGRTVAVIGGGYGGAAVAKALDTDTDVVLIAPKDAFVHAAGSLRALVQPDWAGNILFRYDNLLARGRVVRERAVALDGGGVTPASGARVAADYVVLATGSDYPFPAKTETDVAAEALERLRVAHKELASAPRVLITGAGPVGLELSGEIKAVWPDKAVTVVDPANELLPGFAPEVRADLHRQLDAIGVDLRLGTAPARRGVRSGRATRRPLSGEPAPRPRRGRPPAPRCRSRPGSAARRGRPGRPRPDRPAAPPPAGRSRRRRRPRACRPPR
jgi:NADH dehydrogenase FAD-containing subunit